MNDAEREALERRIDELYAENERMRKTATMLASARTNLLTENAKLRQELAIRESSEQEKVIDYLGKECVDWEDKYLALADENTRLRELMYERAHVYAIQNMTEDELRITATNVMEDNSKLRELCASLFRLANNECISDTRRCDDCPMNRNEPPCNLSLDFIAMRTLGIDVTPWEVERVEVGE